MPKRLIPFCILLYTVCHATVAITATLDEQRKAYQQAKKALRIGNVREFAQLASNLKDYPLYPYLLYGYLQPRLNKANAADVSELLTQYADFPRANEVRVAWLMQLARKREWQTYLENYTPQQDVVLQCNYLLARIITGNHAMLLEDIHSVWLTGSSLPPDCNPVIDFLKKNGRLTTDLAWQRFALALQKNNTGLAQHLMTFMDADHKKAANLWLAVHNSPEQQTKKLQLQDTPVIRKIIGHGIKRLALQNFNTAVKRWDEVQQHLAFTVAERSEIDHLFAVLAAKKKHSRTIELLDKVENFYVDDEIFHLRLMNCLNDNNWHRLRKWTESVPADNNIKYRWMYWHARALAETGATEKAKNIYANIAEQRDYYGFLAADRISKPYNMGHKPLPENPKVKLKITNMPGVQRARELREIGEARLAREEWDHALDQMTSYQQEIAATLAADWGWHGQAIRTMGHARTYDDLEIRFPIPYKTLINEYAHKRQLDQGWMFALVRSESAFIEDAESPAGALGLMQVMPATGKSTAKSIGVKDFKTAHLLEAEKNVPIGSAYLKEMLDSFGGNMILATAAYNAGPHRVSTWLPKTDCMEPDVWVEKIPFTETRIYVRRVMFYASIYDWRLRQSVMPLSRRMTTVSSGGNTRLAQLGCSGQQVSYK